MKPSGAAARIAAVFLIVMVPGCTVRHRLTVRGSEIHRNLGELRAEGAAEVEMVEERDDRDGVRTRREILRVERPLVRGDRRLSITSLVEGCRDVPPFAGDPLSQADCPLVTMREVAFEVRTFETTSLRRPIGVSALVLAGVAGGFAFEGLRGSDSTLETVGNHGVGFLCGFLVAGAFWMVVDCKGRWGQPGCRD